MPRCWRLRTPASTNTTSTVLFTSGTFLNDNIRHHMIIGEHLGIHCKTFCDTLRTGGQSYLNGVHLAKMAIEDGQASAVLLLRGDTTLSGVPEGNALKAYIDYGAHPMEFEVPFGITVPGVYAMMAQRHNARVSERSRSSWRRSLSLAQARLAEPGGVQAHAVTIDDVMNSRMVIDAAAPAGLQPALRRRRRHPDHFAGARPRPQEAAGAHPRRRPGRNPTTNMGHPSAGDRRRAEDKARFGLTRSVQSLPPSSAFGRAGLKPTDVDVAELYDFTSTSPC